MTNKGDEAVNVGGVAVGSVVFLLAMGFLGALIYSWSSNPPAENKQSFAAVVFPSEVLVAEEAVADEAPAEEIEEESWD